MHESRSIAVSIDRRDGLTARHSGISAADPSVVPDPPDTLAPWLAPQGRRLLFTDTAYAEEEVWRPGNADEESLDAAELHLAEIDRLLVPAQRGPLLARILALVSHYRSEAHSEQVETAIANDWAEDLSEFPMWAIDDAARTWRRTRKFRPQISEMFDLCSRAVARHRTRRERLVALLAVGRRGGAIRRSRSDDVVGNVVRTLSRMSG